MSQVNPNGPPGVTGSTEADPGTAGDRRKRGGKKKKPAGFKAKASWKEVDGVLAKHFGWDKTGPSQEAGKRKRQSGSGFSPAAKKANLVNPFNQAGGDQYAEAMRKRRCWGPTAAARSTNKGSCFILLKVFCC